jgi:hypothetical protein
MIADGNLAYDAPDVDDVAHALAGPRESGRPASQVQRTPGPAPGSVTAVAFNRGALRARLLDLIVRMTVSL